MMKFSSIVSTLLVVAPFAQAALLRAPFKEETFKTSTSKAQIVVQGIPQDFSEQDLTVISNSAIAAYNDVHKDGKFSLLTIKPLLHFSTGDSLSRCRLCPESVSRCRLCLLEDISAAAEKVLVADIQVGMKENCVECTSDDSFNNDGATVLANQELFVESFCGLLATSGSKNLAKAHHCSFTFLEKPGYEVAPLALIKSTESESEAAFGFLSVNGLLHKLSANEIALVESATKEAFNEAFAKTSGYYSELNTIRVRSAVKTPSSAKASHTEGHVARDDLVGSVLMLDIGFIRRCRLCTASVEILDENYSQAVAKQWMMSAHDDEHSGFNNMAVAFTEALCTKLRMSGSANLVFADACALDFFYEHADIALGNEVD